MDLRTRFRAVRGYSGLSSKVGCRTNEVRSEGLAVRIISEQGRNFTAFFVIHNFELCGRKVRLWQNRGESYEHVLMKALGYAMFVGEYPELEIERRVGLRYKPDLISLGADGSFDLWGECGLNSIRKTAWLMKHSGARRVVLFKINYGAEQLAGQLRQTIPAKYRDAGRLSVINFVPDIRDLTASGQIAKVSPDWFSETIV